MRGDGGEFASRFLDEYNAFPTNHWAEEPGLGWFHDPLWTRCFPQYGIADREEGIRRYWDDYYGTLGEIGRGCAGWRRAGSRNSILCRLRRACGVPGAA